MRQGIFRAGVDPVQLYISIAGLGYFYLSNSATLGTIFDRDLLTEPALKVRLDHITDILVSYLTSQSESASGPVADLLAPDVAATDA